MTTQTRRTTQRVTKSHSASIKAYIVMACCSLVLLSAVSSYASVSQNGLISNGLQNNGLMSNGLMSNGLISNGLHVNGLSANGLSANGLQQNGESLPAGPQESLPWNGLSRRALGQATAPASRDEHYSLPVELPEVR